MVSPQVRSEGAAARPKDPAQFLRLPRGLGEACSAGSPGGCDPGAGSPVGGEQGGEGMVEELAGGAQGRLAVLAMSGTAGAGTSPRGSAVSSTSRPRRILTRA